MSLAKFSLRLLLEKQIGALISKKKRADDFFRRSGRHKRRKIPQTAKKYEYNPQQ